MSGIEFHPLANIFPLIEGAEFDELVADIKAHRVHDPIWLYQGQILDGRNRYRASAVAGVECPRREYTGDDPAAFVVSLNLKRRHLDEAQRSMVAGKLATMRQGARTDLAPIGAMSDAEAAKLLNVGERSVERAKAVQRDGAPELIAAVEQGKVSVSAAADVATKSKEEQREIVARGEKEILEAAKTIRGERAKARQEQLAEAKAQMAKTVVKPNGVFDVVVIDPPWAMKKIERDVRPNQVAFDYPTMTRDELVDFGRTLEPLVADDCHLFMWTTQKFLPDALNLIAAWGFRYVFTMTWHKAGGFQPIGLAQYNSEFVIYARRGSPTFIETTGFRTCYEWPRREHSRKPKEFYELIARVTSGLRLDVFARERHEGFAQFGNEVDKFDKATLDAAPAAAIYVPPPPTVTTIGPTSTIVTTDPMPEMPDFLRREAPTTLQ